eukprot:974674-Rhodomonas_salina.1
MLRMWSRQWHVNQRMHQVGDDAVVSNRLCVPGVNEILVQNLHVLDPLLQIIERLNGAESFLDCTKVTKEFGVQSRISVVSHNGKHETAGDD